MTREWRHPAKLYSPYPRKDCKHLSAVLSGHLKTTLVPRLVDFQVWGSGPQLRIGCMSSGVPREARGNSAVARERHYANCCDFKVGHGENLPKTQKLTFLYEMSPCQTAACT